MIDDTTARRIVHGSPSGYTLGCRSQGGCANHGHSQLLTCADAYAAAHADWSLSRRPVDLPITKADVKLQRTRPAAPRTQMPAPTPIVEPASATPAAIKPARAPRRSGAPKPAAAAPQRTTPTTIVEPERPMPAADAAPTPKTPSRSPRQQRPSAPKTQPKPKAQPKPRPTRRPAAAREPRAPRPPVHGTVYAHRRGCKTEAECPNYGTDRPTCTAAHHEYYRNYRERRIAGAGPSLTHGTPYGYAFGCHNREDCPGGVDGVTCPDAARTAETQRRRARGIGPAAELTESAPIREHIAQLRAAGMGILEIAAAAGVSKTTLRALIYGRDDYAGGVKGPRHGKIPTYIATTNATRILSVSTPAQVTS